MEIVNQKLESTHRSTHNAAAAPTYANLADPAFRLTMMRCSVAALLGEGSLWYPLLNVIATYIDGLASGPKGGTKAAYLQYLANNLPGLNAAVGAESFYDDFRNAAVHEFSLKPGFAIGRNSGMPGIYASVQQVHGVPGKTLVLNIDLLAEEFLAHLDSLLANLKGSSPVGSAPRNRSDQHFGADSGQISSFTA